MRNIVIIGAGLSGMVSAFYLLKKGIKKDQRIILIEKNPLQIGTGIAYKAEFNQQPLNVRANKMSLYWNQPDHFTKWLNTKAEIYQGIWNDFSSHAFVPRSFYGEYMKEEFSKWKTQFPDQLKIIMEEVENILPHSNGYQLELSNHKKLDAENIILALGNFPPPDLEILSDKVKSSVHYHSYPWKAGITHSIEENETVAFIGMGLTTIDHLITLYHQGHKGKIITISRNGFLPLQHHDPIAFQLEEADVLENCKTPLAFLSFLKQKVKINPQLHWSAVIDAFRPFTNKVWNNWSTEEKKYFLQKIRPFWEIHRHRIPAYSANIISSLKKEGRLFNYAGKIKSVEVNTDEKLFISLIEKFTNEEIVFSVDVLINCTGPDSNFKKFNSPLIKNLLEKKIVCTEPLGMGTLTSESGEVVNKDGQVQKNIWTIGPLRKGQLWESVALNEIRIQAQTITDAIL